MSTDDEIKEIQKYLEGQGITVTETSIINAAIRMAIRWGGYAVFIGEFEKRKDKK